MTEAFEAWLKECEDTWDRIVKMQPLGTARHEAMLILFEKAVRPYFYFLEAYERTTRPAGPSPFGSERGTAPQRGESATAKSEQYVFQCEKCNKEFVPKVKGAKLCLACWRLAHPMRR